MSIESVMPSNHLTLCCPLLLPPSIFPSIRIFSDETVLLIRWPKYWSLSFNLSPSNECSGVSSFRMHWLDHLAIQFSSVQLLSHVLLFATPWTAAPQASCPSPTPRVYPNPCPLSRRCHPTISSSVVPFSSCPQSFPASGSFQMCQLFTAGGQSIGVSASTSVLPMNNQDWFPLGRTGWISLQPKGLSRVFSSIIVQKHQFLGAQLSL